MSFASPQFFLLIPALILTGWFFRPLELWKPLRAFFLLLLVAVLCDPQIALKRGTMDLWVLVDRSLSAREMVDRGEIEWRGLLERSKPGREDRLFFVDYAAEVVPSGGAETQVFSGRRDLTRTSLAIRDTLARMDSRRHNRLLLFTDGYSTEPLTDIGARLVGEGVPLDYRILRPPDVIDFQLAEMHLPSRVQPAEPFVIDLTITGNGEVSLPLTVLRDGEPLFTRPVEVKNGVGRFRFQDRIAVPGAHRYEARIDPEQDAFSGNNRSERWIEVVSGPRIVVLTRYSDDPLPASLRAQGFEVLTVENPPEVSPGILTGAKAVVLNNVPAHELPNSFLRALNFYVTEQGGGLLMAGGKSSFGSGGYHQSAIDELLPVTMELKSEHRRLAVAMAIVMDRSGSMNMITPSGHSKMQLANEGAARAVELLGEQDAATVYAVDTQPHQISPLLNVGKNRGELLKRIRSIQSMGGGIYVYTGMAAAWNELQKSNVGQRHVILFSDASDSEEPGNYQTLLGEMKEAGTSVSVIGLGSRSDSDGEFLADIAERGEGRAFFTNVAEELPNIFAQETVTLARSTFVEESVETLSTGRWHEFARNDLEWMPRIAGYNLNYLREGDEAALVSTDSYTAPLVAFGRRGIGKTAAVTFPLGGEFSTEVRDWGNYGDFLQTLSRWLMGEDVPAGVGIRHRLVGNLLTLDLLYDASEWSERFARTPPELVVERGFDSGNVSEIAWERLSPGHFSTTFEVRDAEAVRGSVKLGSAAIPFGPVTAGTSVEWVFDPRRIAELRETARTSGGGELLDLTGAWGKPSSPERESIRSWLVSLALLLFLLEALVTRTGWAMPVSSAKFFPRMRARARNRTHDRKNSPSTPRQPSPATETSSPPSHAPLRESPATSGKEQADTAGTPTGAPLPKDSRRSRFERAKKRPRP